MVMNEKQARCLSPEYRNFTLDVSGFSHKRLSGFLRHGYLEEPLPYIDWMDWLWKMDWLMCQISFPMHVQVHSRVMKIREHMAEEGAAGLAVGPGPSDGHLATITVNIKSRFHATWQGDASCEETGERCGFMSFLELVLWMEPILSRLSGMESLTHPEDVLHEEGRDPMMSLLSRLVREAGVPDADGSSRMVDQKLFFGTHQANGKPMQAMCHVLFMQNRTWQGILGVRYQDREYRFRSFLELAMLYDGEKRLNGR